MTSSDEMERRHDEMVKEIRALERRAKSKADKIKLTELRDQAGDYADLVRAKRDEEIKTARDAKAAQIKSERANTRQLRLF